MNKAVRISSSIIGGYAGILGIVHGYFEILQGSIRPAGVTINAIGSPCTADEVWHACLPAMTIIPNFFISGILTIVFSTIVLIWIAIFMTKKYSGLTLIMLSIPLLLFGSGFIAPYLCLIAGIAGTRINSTLFFWQKLALRKSMIFLAKIWIWAVSIFVAWAIGGWILGYFLNHVMIRFSFSFFIIFDILLPILVIITAFIHSVRNRAV